MDRLIIEQRVCQLVVLILQLVGRLDFPREACIVLTIRKHLVPDEVFVVLDWVFCTCMLNIR